MSITRDKTRNGYGRILDAWVPPETAGEPIGCVATTFTFKPDLFEEECLGRFLKMQTDSVEDGAAYLIEREEKLFPLMCASVLVDQHHAHGKRNVRWDVLPARIKSGILHAKVSLLLWSSHARLIVGSANLTPPGYRLNHEIFGVLDYYEGGETPLLVLDQNIEFLRELVRVCLPQSNNPGIKRWLEFLKHVQKISRSWGSQKDLRGWAEARVFPVLTGPGRKSVFDTLQDLWPNKVPPTEATVVSPFFDIDPPKKVNVPTVLLGGLLRQRGRSSIEFHVSAEDVPGRDAILVHIPESVTRSDVDTTIRRLKLEDGRHLHAKYISMENDRFIGQLVGSSNFTNAGTGAGAIKNFEANLLYVVDRLQNPEGAKLLKDARLAAEKISKGIQIEYLPESPKGEDAPDDSDLVLPAQFGDAVFRCNEKTGDFFVEFSFQGVPPAGWVVADDAGVFIRESDWHSSDSPDKLRVPWTREPPPSAFKVTWKDANGIAWWLVNVEDTGALQPPGELRDLPLDVLMEVLSSARPLHQALSRWLNRRSSERGTTNELDPHKRVDTSSFLLQRTRKMSWALAGLRQRLEKPLASEQALAWRLHGPLGVCALARAIDKEARSSRERQFLLLELCLELSRVQLIESPGCLPKNRIRSALKNLIVDISSSITDGAALKDESFKNYMKNALKEAGL